MAKKRNCRLTADEADIHAEAVRLRKMTDAQLVAAVREGKERQKPSPASPKPAEATQDVQERRGRGKTQGGVRELLRALEAGRCKGVKGATTYKIAELAKEMGLV